MASRYLTEDVGYTLVFFTDLARRLGVPTPVMDSIIELTSVVLDRDLRGEAAPHAALAGPRPAEQQRAPQSLRIPARGGQRVKDELNLDPAHAATS